MESSLRSRPAYDPTPIAAGFAAMGIFLVLAITVISSGLLLGERVGRDPVIGEAGFGVAFFVPFLIALVALRLQSHESRRAVWLASGVLAVLLAGLTIASLGMLIGVVGIGLIAAWWLAKGDARVLGSWRAIALTGWLLLWLGGALAVLGLRETPVCWTSGAENGHWVAGTSATTGGCTSDIVDSMEGGLALVAVAIGLAGMALIVQGGNRVRGIVGSVGRGPISPQSGSDQGATAISRIT